MKLFEEPAEARAEIERLTKERQAFEGMAKDNYDRLQKAEAERDEARAQVAAAYEAATSICADQFAAHMNAAIYGDPDNSRAREAAAAMAERLLHSIRALTPADAQAALEAYGREKVREGMQRAAGLIAKRRDDYISEYGIYDPTNGATEFPGNGDEYVSELDDCEAAILADMEKLK